MLLRDKKFAMKYNLIMSQFINDFVNRHPDMKSKRYEILGEVQPGFEAVKEEFEAGFRSGIEFNAQLCIYLGKECIVDLCGRRVFKDSSKNPYNADSIQNVFSSTKSLTAIVFATLVDKKLLNYNDKVADHWPEFAEGGKNDIRISDVLRHEAGLVYLDETVMLEDMLPERIKENSIGRIIQRQTPTFPNCQSGSRRQYHSYTRGWILNEIFRRVDPQGRTIGEYLRAEISQPLDADVFIGVRDDDEEKKVVDIRGWTLKKTIIESFKLKPGRRIESNPMDLYRLMKRLKSKQNETAKKRPPAIEGLDKIEVDEFVPSFNRSIIRRGETPSGNGSCSARGLAKIGACIINRGKFEGQTIMSEETVDLFHDDLVPSKTGIVTEFSQGGVNLYRTYPEENEKFVFNNYKERHLREGFYGWMGFGGSVFQWHRDLNVSFAYTPTHMIWHDLQNVRGGKIQQTLMKCLKQEIKQ